MQNNQNIGISNDKTYEIIAYAYNYTNSCKKSNKQFKGGYTFKEGYTAECFQIGLMKSLKSMCKESIEHDSQVIKQEVVIPNIDDDLKCRITLAFYKLRDYCKLNNIAMLQQDHVKNLSNPSWLQKLCNDISYYFYAIYDLIVGSKKAVTNNKSKQDLEAKLEDIIEIAVKYQNHYQSYVRELDASRRKLQDHKISY